MGGVGPNVGGSGLTMLISSYCSQIKLQMLADAHLGMNPRKLMDYIENEIELCITKYAKQA